LRSNRYSSLLGTALLIIGSIGILSTLAVGVAAVTLPSCESCHLTAEFKAETSVRAHSGISCVRCHVRDDIGSRLSYGAYEVFGMALHNGPDYGRTAAEVADSTCKSCHAEVGKRAIMRNGLRMQHSTCAKGRHCTDCHSDTAHGVAVSWLRTATMETCLDCHSSAKVRGSCTTCHLVPPTANKSKLSERYVTHNANWKVTHGLGEQKTCAACHPPEFCAPCHTVPVPHPVTFARTHGKLAIASRTACKKCHPDTSCTLCHATEMPHPKAFASEHPKIVKSKGDKPCLRCHVRADCDGCHVAHVHPGGATGGDEGVKR
jgi:hypothetical protein